MFNTCSTVFICIFSVWTTGKQSLVTGINGLGDHNFIVCHARTKSTTWLHHPPNQITCNMNHRHFRKQKDHQGWSGNKKLAEDFWLRPAHLVIHMIHQTETPVIMIIYWYNVIIVLYNESLQILWWFSTCSLWSSEVDKISETSLIIQPVTSPHSQTLPHNGSTQTSSINKNINK